MAVNQFFVYVWLWISEPSSSTELDLKTIVPHKATMGLDEGSGIMLVGMVVVFSVLVFIALVMQVLGTVDIKLIQRKATKALEADKAKVEEEEKQAIKIEPAKPSPSAEVSPVEPADEEPITEELLAIITAAISAAMQKPVRVYGIRYIQPTYRLDTAWNVQAKAEAMPNYYE